MGIDWQNASLELIAGLYPAKAEGNPETLHRQIVVLAQHHARAHSAVLLQRLTQRTFQTLAATFQVQAASFDTEWLILCLADSCIRLEARRDGRLWACLPLHQGDFQGALLLILEGITGSETAFMKFLDRTRSEAHEVIRLVHKARLLDEWRTRSNAILETIPQAVIFVDNHGKQAWINRPAASLLGVADGENEPRIIANAMQRLRVSATNAEEISQTGSQLFSAPDQTIKDWKWLFGEPLSKALNVASLPICSTLTPGRLWVFDDITLLYDIQENLHRLNKQLEIKTQEAED